MRRAALFLLVLALLTGCGEAEVAAPLPETVVGTVAQPGGKGDPAAGKKIYEAAGCGACHAFDPAGSTGNIGPNLNELPELAEQANQGTLEEFTRTSVTNPNAYVEKSFSEGTMPPFTGSGKELDDLVAFLTESK